MLETLQPAHEARYRHRWYGKYRAFVRDNNDPERLGRCRLEIPAVLGTGSANWSDWASPCFPYGGHEDTGMFLIPEEGASVWAEFEGGNVQYPIWAGVWLAGSNPGEQPEESKRLCEEPTCHDCEDKVEHARDRHDDLEHKKYHGHPPYTCPRRRVLLKSETGHTFVVDDRDEEEFLKIIDRAGQIFHMACPVKRDVQSGNARRRGTGDAEQGDGLDVASDLKDQQARIEITDLSRQFIRWEAWQDHEKIHIQSSDKTRSRWQKILLDTTKDREKVHLWGLGGAQEILIDSTAGKEKIRLRDKAGQVLVLNAGKKRIELKDGGGGEVILDRGTVLVRSGKQVLINP